MNSYAVFLRGINVGGINIKMADLKDALKSSGFADVKTLLASGNVLFDADAVDARAIETALEKQFGFEIGPVLRSQAQLRDLVALDPFAGRVEDDKTKLYVTFVDDSGAKSLPMPCAIPGDFEVVKLTDGEVFALAFRDQDGRYGLGMEVISKHFGKKRLWTSRNWNTVLKAAK